jgi:hypothetical protein
MKTQRPEDTRSGGKIGGIRAIPNDRGGVQTIT